MEIQFQKGKAEGDRHLLPTPPPAAILRTADADGDPTGPVVPEETIHFDKPDHLFPFRGTEGDRKSLSLSWYSANLFFSWFSVWGKEASAANER